MMHIEVKDDRILIGTDFVPRFLDLPRVLQIKEGQTYTAKAEEHWDYIENSGLFVVSRDHGTEIRATHFFTLPVGITDMGTADDPLIKADLRIVLNNVPIDKSRDPFGWGNGFLNFGKQFRVGCDKTEWVEAVGDLAQGATQVTLAMPPVNWEVGDELLIPDTMTQTHSNTIDKTFSLREAPITIAAIHGPLVTFSKGLDFPHPNIRMPDGTVVLRPRIVNLTRCISLESENAATPLVGTRGHTANVGMDATFDIRCNQFIQLGRTLNDPIDDSDGKVPAKQQKGRYANHQHHVGSAPGSQCIANVYRGNPVTTKWAHAVHGTHDILVAREVALDFPGAAFVTEDGNEVRNTFRRCLAAYIEGTPPVNDPDGNIKINRPGSEGSGFWFRGVMNTFEGLEAWNCYRSGINLFNILQPAGLSYPSMPGMMPDTPFDRRAALPIAFTDNITACNNDGTEIWGTKRFPVQHLIAAYNWDRQIFVASSDDIAFEGHDLVVVGEVGKGGGHEGAPGGFGIHSGDGYVDTFDLFNSTIVGCVRGIAGGGSANGVNIIGGRLQNEIDIDQVHTHLLLDGVTCSPLPGLPKRHIELTAHDIPDGFIWDGVSPLPNRIGFTHCATNRGSDFIIKNCPGLGEPGKSYRLYCDQAKGNLPAWYSTATGSDRHVYNPPAKGLTWQQAWDRFGMGYLGGVVDPAAALTLEGVRFGVALEGLHTPLGPPKIVITYPTDYEAAVVQGGVLRVQLALTGDHTLASPWVFGSVDGGPPLFSEGQSLEEGSVLNDQRGLGLEGAAITPGLHVLKAWRTTIADPLVPIPGSEYSVTYGVGATPPPIEPPPVTTTTVPNVVGLTKSAATAAIMAAKLKLGAVSTAPDALPAGQVFRQIPDAGLTAAIGSAVNLNLSSGPVVPPPSEETWTPAAMMVEKSSKGRVRITIG